MAKKLKKIIKEDLLNFNHTYNPEHFYCRLKDLGIPKRIARKYSERYELEIYKPLIKYLKNA